MNQKPIAPQIDFHYKTRNLACSSCFHVAVIPSLLPRRSFQSIFLLLYQTVPYILWKARKKNVFAHATLHGIVSIMTQEHLSVVGKHKHMLKHGAPLDNILRMEFYGLNKQIEF